MRTNWNFDWEWEQIESFDWEWEQIERHIWRRDHLASKSRPLSQAEPGWSWIKQHTLTNSAFQSIARLLYCNGMHYALHCKGWSWIKNHTQTNSAICIPDHCKTTDLQGHCIALESPLPHETVKWLNSLSEYCDTKIRYQFKQSRQQPQNSIFVREKNQREECIDYIRQAEQAGSDWLSNTLHE